MNLVILEHAFGFLESLVIVGAAGGAEIIYGCLGSGFVCRKVQLFLCAGFKADHCHLVLAVRHQAVRKFGHVLLYPVNFGAVHRTAHVNHEKHVRISAVCILGNSTHVNGQLSLAIPGPLGGLRNLPCATFSRIVICAARHQIDGRGINPFRNLLW